jgi:hypothetical protein
MSSPFVFGIPYGVFDFSHDDILLGAAGFSFVSPQPFDTLKGDNGAFHRALTCD